MYTLGAGRILKKSNIIVCLLNLMAWKASWAHRTGENEKKDNDKIKKPVQTSSACVLTRTHNLCFRAKIMYTLCKPQFYYIQVGCKGVFVTRIRFRDGLVK